MIRRIAITSLLLALGTARSGASPPSATQPAGNLMPATRENLLKNQANLLELRGKLLAALDRKAEARTCFQKVLAIDPSNDPSNAAAQEGLK